MNEREIGRKLLELDAAELAQPPDPRWHTSRILERDRSRGRWLTVIAVGLWGSSTLLIMAVLVILGLLFPMKAKIQQERGEWEPAKVAQMEHDVEVGIDMMVVLTAFASIVSAGAVLCTLLLVVNSRRATLRQVNANLLEICDQLRNLQKGEAKQT